MPADVTHSVYARMRAERKRKVKKYRSEGREAATEREKTILLA
jgi:regulator of protease activity HflC (stomatin/prohibitin superfamily)